MSTSMSQFNSSLDSPDNNSSPNSPEPPEDKLEAWNDRQLEHDHDTSNALPVEVAKKGFIDHREEREQYRVSNKVVLVGGYEGEYPHDMTSRDGSIL